jgi:hypothetical protein
MARLGDEAGRRQPGVCLSGRNSISLTMLSQQDGGAQFEPSTAREGVVQPDGALRRPPELLR